MSIELTDGDVVFLLDALKVLGQCDLPEDVQPLLEESEELLNAASMPRKDEQMDQFLELTRDVKWREVGG